MFQKAKLKKRGKMNSRWSEGVFLGVVPVSHEYIIGTADGIQRCRTMRRFAPSCRWNLENINKIRGTPWQWKPNPDDAEASEPPKASEVPVEPMPAADPGNRKKKRGSHKDAIFENGMSKTEEHRK